MAGPPRWRARRGVHERRRPALLVAQAIGRIGNYFNQELFGKPSGLPWAVQISMAARLNSGMPARYLHDLAWAAVLVWLGHHRKIAPQGLFAL